MSCSEMEAYIEMRDLEMETLPAPVTPPATPTDPPTPATTAPTNPPTGILIPGLNQPPARFFPPGPAPQATHRSNIVNPSRRHAPRQQHIRCLLHLTIRCPICHGNQRRNPRVFRQEGIRAILQLIHDVFGVRLNPRELALFIAGFYAN